MSPIPSQRVHVPHTHAHTHTHTHTCVQAHTDLAFPHFCLKAGDLFSELQSLPTRKKHGGKKVNKGSSADVPFQKHFV